jgi:O-antigen/teichoic acid export membrane protein
VSAIETAHAAPPRAPVSSDPAGDATPPSIWRRIRRDLGLFAAGNIGVVLAQLGFRLILVAALVPAAYGRLTLILTIYNTVWIIGASGLPSSVARYIAMIAPADDAGIIRSAIRAGVWPTLLTGALMAVLAGTLLHSPVAAALAVVGVVSLVYSLLAMGILRGRGHAGRAAAILLIAGIGEVGLLALLWQSGIGVSALSAFSVFCLGNVLGLAAGVAFAARTRPQRTAIARAGTRTIPAPRELLGFSLWLAAATGAVTVLPLILRSAAALDSYTLVAVIDVAIVLLSIPQRVGAVMLMAVVPHATRALARDHMRITISRREHAILIVPFLLAAAVVAFTPVVAWVFDALGRHVYAQSADYLALALLAGPARILYGLVEGILIAYGDGRFLALSAVAVTTVATGLIFAAVALGSMHAAFVVFVAAVWTIYLAGLARIGFLASTETSANGVADAVHA